MFLGVCYYRMAAVDKCMETSTGLLPFVMRDGCYHREQFVAN